MMKISSIRGTRDILAPEVFIWQSLEDIAKNTFNLYGYKRIITPIIEDASLFARSIGTTTDIVQKQMYVFKDKGNRQVCLRPEATASVVRAYLENNLDKKEGMTKLFYIGPMFRAERPQAGRQRQFYQIGVEVIGSFNPHIDIEIIFLLDDLLKRMGATGYIIKLNSLGCEEDKKHLAKKLKNELKFHINALCKDCKARYKKNVFRILDCKNPGCQKTIHRLNIMSDYLCQDCAKHFNGVKNGLDSMGVGYKYQPYLVRGLDYYTRTVFEVTYSGLGAQDAIAAGGRYDNLTQDLGGPKLGACGFAIGLDRLIMAIGDKKNKTEQLKKNSVYIATIGQDAYEKGFQILFLLRGAGIISQIDYENKSLKAQMREADKLCTKFVVLIGEDELKKNVVTIRNMDSKEQKEVRIENLINELMTNDKAQNPK